MVSTINTARGIAVLALVIALLGGFVGYYSTGRAAQHNCQNIDAVYTRIRNQNKFGTKERNDAIAVIRELGIDPSSKIGKHLLAESAKNAARVRHQFRSIDCSFPILNR